MKVVVASHRSDRGWDLEIYGPGEAVHLRSIDLELSMEIVYRGVQ